MLSLEGMNSITSCTEAKVASKNSPNNSNSDLLKPTVPIKVVDKTTLTKLHNTVTKGEGNMSTIAGIPFYANHRKYAKNVWRVLLDSGSEGDILFIHKSQTHKRDCIKTRVARISLRTVALPCAVGDVQHPALQTIQPNALCTARTQST